LYMEATLARGTDPAKGAPMKSSRRSFLKTGLALPALSAASVIAQTPAGKDSSFDPWVEIHPSNLRHNVSVISRRSESHPDSHLRGHWVGPRRGAPPSSHRFDPRSGRSPVSANRGRDDDFHRRPGF
ncbi:MAG: hypothetical protein ACREAB_08710, partial [Blastocatellia bacterium]